MKPIQLVITITRKVTNDTEMIFGWTDFFFFTRKMIYAQVMLSVVEFDVGHVLTAVMMDSNEGPSTWLYINVQLDR